jgi:hypothetical protein
VTGVPRSQIGPTSRRRSRPRAAASLQPEFGPRQDGVLPRADDEGISAAQPGTTIAVIARSSQVDARRHVVHHVVEPRPAQPNRR